MLSSTMMYGLIVCYIVIAVVSTIEGNVWRSVYWVAASLLTFSVLRMT